MRKVAGDRPTRNHMIAVIGPGSNTSRGLWREIAEQQGWLSVAVMPQDATDHGLTNPPDDGWDAVITANRWDVKTLGCLLAGVDGIIGDEGSIELADEVARNLKLPHNDPKTSTLRYDKAQMTEALQLKGLPVPTTFHVSSLGEAKDAAKVIGYPLVVKLPASCAADRFTVCQNLRELEVVWQQTIGERSILGTTIDSVLIQERLTGPVYAVNSITLAPGEHLVIDVWRDIHREGDGAAYVRFDLLDSRDQLYQSLTARAKEAIEATGIVWGVSHIEMMQNADGEWVVIDLAARPAGWYPAVIRLVSDLSPGPSQAEAAVLAITDPDGLRHRLTSRARPHGKISLLFMLVPRDAMVVDAATLSNISKLPGVRGIIGPNPGPADDYLAGQAVPKTTGAIDLVGGWCLAGAPDVIETTMRRIRELEQQADGLYRPPHPS